jgi:2-keto-4-pentenoate hydratase
MQTDMAFDAAQLLGKARQEKVALLALPEHCRPASIEEGYAIQRAFIQIWRQPVVGWKIGATAPAVQKLFKIHEPFFGPIHAAGLLRSPAVHTSDIYQSLIVESEFVFRLGRDLPPRAEPWSREEVVASVEGVAPAFELISSRFNPIPFDDVASCIADCGLNGGLVIGSLDTDWRKLDLAAHEVHLSVDGVLLQSGSGANVLGHPLNVLLWAVNSLSSAGLGMRRGQYVSTGTVTGVHSLKPGETAIADFGDLGRVELKFT